MELRSPCHVELGLKLGLELGNSIKNCGEREGF